MARKPRIQFQAQLYFTLNLLALGIGNQASLFLRVAQWKTQLLV